MLKKIAILFLVTLLCLGSMTSCFIVIDERTGEVKPPRTEAQTLAPAEKVPSLPDSLEEMKKTAATALSEGFDGVNFDGETFTVVIAYDDSVSFKTYQESAYTKALKMQEELIEEAFNCKVIINRISYTTLVSDAQASMNAGLSYADVVVFPESGLGYLKQHKLIAELKGLYGDRLADPLFDEAAMTNASAKNGIYGIGGRFCLNPASYGCVYLNKEMSDEMGITDEILELVANGGWTVDAMLSYKDKLADREGTVLLTAKSDSTVIDSIFGASGLKYMTADPAGLPALKDNGASVDAVTEKLRGFAADTAVCSYSTDAHKVFEKDKALFFMDTLASSPKIKGSYAVLPLPKLNAEQTDYVYYSNGNTPLFGVLSTNNRPEYAIDLMKAFNITADLIYEAWARDLLDYVLREESSYNVIKNMFAAKDYDPALMYSAVYPSVKAATSDALKSAVLSDKPFSFYSSQQVWNVSRDMGFLFP